MYNDVYLSLQHHAEYFHRPKNPLALSFPTPTIINLFIVSKLLLSSECHTVGIIQYVQLMQPGFFHLVISILLPSMSFHGLVAHFVLELNNIPLSRSTTVYPIASIR